MSDSKYSVYSKFDLQKHVENFVDYLEVIITPDGEVLYAVPCHAEVLEECAAKQQKTTVEDIVDKCPEEYYCDYHTYLILQSECVAVWTRFCSYKKLTKQQLATLRKLKMSGAYKGKVPKLSEITS